MKGRTIALVLAAVLVAGLAVAAGAKAPAKTNGTTHDLSVQVVSVDAKAKTMTVKDDKGETKTVPVMGHALQQLGTVTAGETITVTCHDNAKGEHQGIVAIKAPKAGAK